VAFAAMPPPLLKRGRSADKSKGHCSNLLCRSRFVQVALVPRATVRRMRAGWITCRQLLGAGRKVMVMKYALTTVAALSFGSLSFRISHLLGWNHLGERLLVLAGALFAAAFLCAPLWS
jgi:hypothetical protein